METMERPAHPSYRGFGDGYSEMTGRVVVVERQVSLAGFQDESLLSLKLSSPELMDEGQNPTGVRVARVSIAPV